MTQSLINRASVLQVLGEGRAQAKSSTQIVYRICGLYECQSHHRQLRMIVNELRKEGNQICSSPTGGYFIAKTEEELKEYCEFLHARAMVSLVQIAAMRRVAVPNLRKQLKLDIEVEQT